MECDGIKDGDKNVCKSKEDLGKSKSCAFGELCMSVICENDHYHRRCTPVDIAESPWCVVLEPNETHFGPEAGQCNVCFL